MKPLTLDQILAADSDVSRKTEAVPVPEWGGTVHVRQMTAAERDAYDSIIYDDNGDFNRTNFRGKLLAACVCDEFGTLLLKPTDAEAIGAKGAVAVGRIYTVAAKLNHLTKESSDAGKDGSGAGTAGDSSSVSPSNASAPTSTPGSPAYPPE